MSKLNVLYLTWGESVIRNGVFMNQVIEQLRLIREQGDDIDIRLLSGVPVISRVRITAKDVYMREKQEVVDRFAQWGIPMDVKEFLGLQSVFYTPFYLTPLFYVGQKKFFREYVLKHQIDIVHCRSYHATRLAVETRQKYGLCYKIIFDTRGLFPEEGAFKKMFAYKGTSYNKWKKIEKKLLNESDVVVNVSGTFSEHIRSICSNARIETIHTTSNMDIFRINEKQRKQAREKLGIADDERVLVFLGGISHNTWHSPDYLGRLYSAFREYYPKSRLLLITRNDKHMLLASFKRYNIKDRDCIFVGTNRPEDTAYYLNAADYASLPYRDVGGEVQRLIGYTMVASKTGEYLAVGLPMLVNSSVGEASRIIREQGIGCVYDVGEEKDIHSCLNKIDENYSAIRDKCVQTAHKYFNARENAKRYVKIYRSLISE